MKIKAALFDLDGTLIDSEILWIDSYMEVLSSLGFVVNREFAISQVHGKSFKDLYNLTCSRFPNFNLSLVDTENRMRKNFIQFKRERNIIIRSSVNKLIELAKDCYIAIVSGSTRGDIFTAIDLMKINEHVEYVVGAEDCQRGKPDPEGYLKAMNYKGLQPKECLVFEDSKIGISAAKSAGMHCVALTVCNHFNTDQKQADKIVSDLSQVRLEEFV